MKNSILIVAFGLLILSATAICAQDQMKPFCKIFLADEPITSTRSDCRELPPLLPCLILLLHSTRILVRFRARNAVLTVTRQTCKIACVHGVTTQVYAGSRKPLVWLRPPPSAPSFIGLL